MFQYDCALGFFIECKNGISTEVLHRANQFAADFAGHQVAMKSLSGERSSYSTIRTDQPKIETQLLSNRQSKCVTAACHQHDFDASRVGAPQRVQVVF